jgi:flagellar protein FlbD
MIAITDLRGTLRYVNAELVECVEATPDTQILLSNGHRYFARERPAEVVERILEYRRACGLPPRAETLQPSSRRVNGEAT